MNFVKEFLGILSIESDALRAAQKNQNSEAVFKAVESILAFDGMIKVVGVGKSAIIGQKIAATLTSTGTPAISMHAADAMHGDLGLVSDKDIVILISYSGESDEILSLLPHLKSRDVKIIALVGNMHSRLAQAANINLNASIDKEACPLNLAPTASTSVTLALGDALAMTLMKSRGITEQNFAFNHPAGRLGKRLSLRVEDLMHGENSYATCKHTANLRAIISLLTEKALGGVCVVDDFRNLSGLITDGDVRRAILKDNFINLRADDIMTKRPVTIQKNQLAYDALKLMEGESRQLSILPVVNGDQSVGLIRLHDLVQAGL